MQYLWHNGIIAARGERAGLLRDDWIKRSGRDNLPWESEICSEEKTRNGLLFGRAVGKEYDPSRIFKG